jgi:hypothetical protein
MYQRLIENKKLNEEACQTKRNYYAPSNVELRKYSAQHN